MVYIYECARCGRFELQQSIHDDALISCPKCGGLIHRVICPAEVIWLGRFRWMKGNPEVDMDKIEARENREEEKKIDAKIAEGLKQPIFSKSIW